MKCLNRTSVGLKRQCHDSPCRGGQRLNRTSVGLKHSRRCFSIQLMRSPQSNQRGIETINRHRSHLDLRRPQSNQRGIETQSINWRPHCLQLSLNRTSVGLKHSMSASVVRGPLRLNRTSVGLKHAGVSIPNRFSHYRLNRTSVGLKRGYLCLQQAIPDLPQSNQRGIETQFEFTNNLPNLHRLNRTSVGLKLT